MRGVANRGRLGQIGPAVLLSLVSALSVTVSAAAADLQKKDSCVYVCGSNCYWQSDIDAALAKGYSLYQEGETEGMLTSRISPA